MLTGFGADPLEVSKENAQRIVDGARGSSPVLDQSVLRGVAILADEELWRARSDPQRDGKPLSRKERGRYAACWQGYLRKAIGCEIIKL